MKVMAMVSINLPLWRGRYSAGRRQAAAEFRAAEYSYLSGVNAIESELNQRYNALREAHRRQHLNQAILLPRAEEVWETVEAGYRTGISDFQELLEVLRILVQLRLDQVNLETELFRRYADWEQLARPFEYEKSEY
ncbi:MAG: TolC family protein [Verrucomicrobia bacterium]|nr:TolC family protein [Verrucomicrobiota bacterium]